MSNSTALPPANFLNKMEHLLGDEYESFVKSYAQQPPMGLRVNTLKISPADFSSKSPFRLTPVGPYEPTGFLATDDSQPGRHPHHAAGLYYLQEPSAMAVARILNPQPGECVLDIAAAPGGKATHLAALMADSGLLVANDIDAKRARILAQNLERWGTQNTLITNAHPEQLAQRLGPVFDRVLVDAPCSGEGMFRRLGAFAWDQEMVLACARRQTAVLQTAAKLVKPGGWLAYTTCTFSPEEDEQVIAQFLTTHAAFELADPPRFTGFDQGRPSWVTATTTGVQIDKTVRLWPHNFHGEGHFIALMRRAGTKKPEHFKETFGFKPPKRSELKAWHDFANVCLGYVLPEEQMLLKNGRLYLLPEQTVYTRGLKLIRYGLLLGEIRKGYFKPAHTFALALSQKAVTTTVNWSADAPETTAYLAGHDIPIQAREGWYLVTVDGFSLGWGKVANGRLKNHYPRGLRQPGYAKL